MDFANIDAINLYCDGGCEPNPGGIASFGWVMYERLENGENGRRIIADWKVVSEGGDNATNNYAEYCGLGFAVLYMKDVGYRGDVYVYSDSKLLVHQVTDEWNCNKKHLKKLRNRIWSYLDAMYMYHCTPANKRVLENSGLQQEGHSWFVLQWIPRAQNEEADALSTRARIEYLQGKD